MKNKLFPNIKRFTTIFSIALLGITVVLIALRLIAFSDFATAPTEDKDASNTNGQVTIPTEGEETPGAEDVAYSINRHIYFSTPDSAGEIQIDNPAASPYDIRVTITRNDNGKSIYMSGALRPGSSIQTAKIQGARLPEGVYECTAEISTYDIGGSKKLGGTEVPVTLYIGEENMPG